MHDVGFGRSLHQVAFSGMRRDDVTDCVGNPALHGQRDAGKRMPQHLAALTLAGLAIGLFVLQQLANIGEDGARDPRVLVNRQCVPHELGHAFSGLARDVHHAALVLHKSRRAIRNQEGERNVVQIVGCQRAAFQRQLPSLPDFLSQLRVFDPFQLWPQLLHHCVHANSSAPNPRNSPRRHRRTCPIWQNGYWYHFALPECYEARHKLQVTLSSRWVISSAGVSGSKRKGLPIITLSSPRRAIFRPESFMSKSPSIRSGTTGTPSFCASIPTPDRNGDGLPSCVRRPSGNTTTL